LATSPGGVPIGGSDPTWTGSVGNVDGLGIGTPIAGASVVTNGVIAGALYTTPIDLVISATGNIGALLTVYVSTPFTHSSVLDVRICYPAATCSSAASYQAVSKNAAAPTAFTVPPGLTNGTYRASLAVFVSNINGPQAFSGADAVTLTFQTWRSSNNRLTDTDTLVLSQNVQTALQLSLSSAGGLPIATGSNFSIAFSSVNGLGIGPGTGLTVSTSPGSALYSTPYAIQARFAGFSSTTGTVRAYVSGDFAHPAILELRDSPDNNAFGGISKTAASPTTLNASVSSGAAFTRYLGLLVSGLNGASAFTGTDTATLQFILIVP
jgi:hypothetical protein